jgi:hypothetical protein
MFLTVMQAFSKSRKACQRCAVIMTAVLARITYSAPDGNGWQYQNASVTLTVRNPARPAPASLF